VPVQPCRICIAGWVKGFAEKARRKPAKKRAAGVKLQQQRGDGEREQGFRLGSSKTNKGRTLDASGSLS
jgi:hypothetical protein